MLTDSYNDIRQHAKSYSETGSTATSLHGRGQRVAKKNARYLDTDDDAGDSDDDDDDYNDFDEDDDIVIHAKVIFI